MVKYICRKTASCQTAWVSDSFRLIPSFGKYMFVISKEIWGQVLEGLLMVGTRNTGESPLRYKHSSTPRLLLYYLPSRIENCFKLFSSLDLSHFCLGRNILFLRIFKTCLFEAMNKVIKLWNYPAFTRRHGAGTSRDPFRLASCGSPWLPPERGLYLQCTPASTAWIVMALCKQLSSTGSRPPA